MILILTKVDGTKIIVNSDSVKMWEPNPSEPNHTDVVFGADMVRVVTESLSLIISSLNPVTPH